MKHQSIKKASLTHWLVGSKNGILHPGVEKMEIPKLLYEFHNGFCKGNEILQDKSLHKRSWIENIIGLHCSSIHMIITRNVKCVTLMLKSWWLIESYIQSFY